MAARGTEGTAGGRADNQRPRERSHGLPPFFQGSTVRASRQGLLLCELGYQLMFYVIVAVVMWCALYRYGFCHRGS